MWMASSWFATKRKSIDKALIAFNKQRINIKFTIKKGINNSINFQDLTIHPKKTKVEFVIYRKHAQTDILPNDMCHPHEQKC
jgi:hypothetical protein